MASGTSGFKWHDSLHSQIAILIGLYNGLFKMSYLNVRECLLNSDFSFGVINGELTFKK